MEKNKKMRQDNQFAWKFKQKINLFLKRLTHREKEVNFEKRSLDIIKFRERNRETSLVSFESIFENVDYMWPFCINNIANTGQTLKLD